MTECVYQLQENHHDLSLGNGVCENPWIARGNGDALCHRIHPARKVGAMLKLYVKDEI